MTGDEEQFADEQQGVKWPDSEETIAKLKRFEDALIAIRSLLKFGAEQNFGVLVKGAYKIACDALQEEGKKS